MARKIVITGGKGGVGKTTVTANLGVALAKLGLRVVVADLDVGLNNLDVATETDNQIVFDIIDVIEGKCRVKQALLQNAYYPSLFVLPCSNRPNRQLQAEEVAAVVAKLDEQFDYLLIDCPAGVEYGFYRAVSSADEAIVVCTPHLASIRDASKVISILTSNSNLIDVMVVVNRLRGDLVVAGKMLDAFEVFSLLQCKPLGIIPEDDEINCTGKSGEKNLSFDILANNLHNGASEMLDCVTCCRDFFGRAKKGKVG